MSTSKQILFTCIFLGVAFVSLAQSPPYTSRLGRFQVDQIKGCAPFTVTITNANVITTGECTSGKPCLMDYEGKNNQQQNQFSFTYTTPGTYKLTVLYQSIGADDITITVDQNIQPSVEVYSCASNKVSIKVTDNNYDQYVIDFNNDGTPEILLPFTNSITAQNTYSSAGTYTISVRGRDLNAADNCSAKMESFTAITTLPAPSITTLTAIDASNIKLDFTPQTHIQQRLEIAVNNATNFQLLQTLYQTSTLNVPNLRVDDNYYAFRLSAYDPCTNTNTYSPFISSHNLDLAIQSGVNNLTWATATSGINNVTIQRNQQTYITLPGAPLSFSDNNVICQTNYCYSVISNYAGGSKSISLEKCGISFTNTAPPAIDNISTVVGNPDNGVELSWSVASGVNGPEFSVIRLQNDGYQILETITTTTKTDSEYTTESGYCYRIDYKDACDNTSPEGRTACPIRLAGTLDDLNTATLTWPKYNGWTNGVSNYTVEKYNQKGALIGTVNVGTDTFYVDSPPDARNQLIRYRVKAISTISGVTASISNVIEIIKKTKLFSPTAFTPNSDQLNDTFAIGGQYIATLNLKIFDRWGVLIFSSDSESWNGTRSETGQPMPAGTYIWKADIVDFAGQRFSEKGIILLIRKSN